MTDKRFSDASEVWQSDMAFDTGFVGAAAGVAAAGTIITGGVGGVHISRVSIGGSFICRVSNG